MAWAHVATSSIPLHKIFGTFELHHFIDIAKDKELYLQPVSNYTIIIEFSSQSRHGLSEAQIWHIHINLYIFL